MRKIYPLVFFIFLFGSLFSQTALFNNNGASIYVKDGGFMIVKTNSLHNNVVAGNGLLDNQGTIVVEGYVKNDATINGNGDTIKVLGDWINDNNYIGNNSWVHLNGNVPVQNITGSAVTTFNNLDISAGPEKFQTINTIVNGLLNLNNSELATDVHQLFIDNVNRAAISWGNGYVSSLGAGRLSRLTNATNTYLFPVGSPSYNNGPSIFRPIEMTPNTTIADTFSACLVKGNATSDGYNVQTVDKILCMVNPNFYHRLYNGSGAAAADLTMYYNTATDGDWTDEAHWKNNQWNYMGTSTAGTGLGFSTVTVPAVSDFNPEPFALATKKFQLLAGPDVHMVEGQSVSFSPTIGAGAGASIEWTPDLYLTCNTCADPVADPPSTTRYTITVTDPAGCKLADSLLVDVTMPALLVPTGFSPNGDGENDVFHVLNKNLAKLDLVVFNRWGEKVFETTDWTVGWDGTYKGMKQEIGVYIWECSYQFLGEKTLKTAKGNVTLIR